MRAASPRVPAPASSRNKQCAVPSTAKRPIHDGLPLEITYLGSLDCVVSFQSILHAPSPPVYEPPLHEPPPSSPPKRSRPPPASEADRPRTCSMRIADLLNLQPEAPCRAEVTEERWRCAAANEKPLRLASRYQLMPQERVFAIERQWTWMPIPFPEQGSNLVTAGFGRSPSQIRR